MTTIYEVPLSPQPQKITISLNSAQYVLSFVWNNYSNIWIMDILDANRNPIAQGIPLVTGSDLLGQFNYLQIGGGLNVQTDHNTNAVPTFDNLGIESHLYWLQP